MILLDIEKLMNLSHELLKRIEHLRITNESLFQAVIQEALSRDKEPVSV